MTLSQTPSPRPLGGLVYVIGASGAGKDTLLRWARQRLDATRPDLPVAFAHRYITRPDIAGHESHVALSETEFDQRLSAGLFSMHWAAHDLRYGIGIEIDAWRAAGLTVVVNGSRGYLDEAARRHADLRPVLVSARLDMLRRRLEARGREQSADIESRLARAETLSVRHPALAVVDNSDTIAVGGARLLALIEAIAEASVRAKAGLR
jgi:ribose 1,5-bisphosphokinase